MICPRCQGIGTLPDSIGSLIRNERESQGLSQDQVARIACISRNGLAIIERGGNAQLETLTAIAKALGLRLDVQMVRDESPSDLTSLPPDGPASQIVDNENRAGGAAGEPNR